MGRRRKGSSGGLAGVVFGAIVLAIATIPKESWREMLGAVAMEEDKGADVDGVTEDDELASFKL